jgi:hypothetical protein
MKSKNKSPKKTEQKKPLPPVKKIERTILFPQLEEQFQVEITIRPDISEYRISNHTGKIEVQPIFEFLDYKIQSFIVIQLVELARLNNLEGHSYSKAIICADTIAVKKIGELYPNEGRGFWARAFAQLVKSNESTSTVQRIENVINKLYYSKLQCPFDDNDLEGIFVSDLGEESYDI